MMATTPLNWPARLKRTEKRKSAAFSMRGSAALAHLEKQVALFGGRNLMISTNLRVGRYTREIVISDPNPSDPGVAIFFDRGGKEMCIACDRWAHVIDNIRAIGLSLEAIRGIERWGTEEMVDAALAGYAALPSGEVAMAVATVQDPADPWWIVMGMRKDSTREEVHREYRSWVRIHHPDAGGDPERFREVTEAYQQALAEVQR